MATFVGEAHASSDGTNGSISVDVPAGTQDGDIIVAAVFLDSADDVDPSSGWTQILTPTESGLAEARMFWREALSEPASYTWTRNSGSWPYGVAHLVFRDVDTTGGTPIHVAAKSGTDQHEPPGDPLTAPQVTTTDTTDILTFCSSERQNGSVILHASPDGGTELVDWGHTKDSFYANSGAVYHKAELNPGNYAFSVDLSGSEHKAAALFTVALKSGGIEGTMAVSAPAAPSFQSSAGIVADGTVAATAPLAVLDVDAITDLVRGDVSTTTPVAELFLSSVNLIDGPLTATAPLAKAEVSGHHDAFGTLTPTAPTAVLFAGAETRIFGARIVVVRPEPRVRYPF